MGTELRFLRQLNIDGFKDSLEAQFWHGRALEMSLSFLPGDSPFVKHIIHSYQKHHSPSSQTIPEDYSISPHVKVVKPLKGVHFNKITPMIQDCDFIYEKTRNDSKKSQKLNSNSSDKSNNLFNPSASNSDSIKIGQK